jgi:hypothetical protein
MGEGRMHAETGLALQIYKIRKKCKYKRTEWEKKEKTNKEEEYV